MTFTEFMTRVDRVMLRHAGVTSDQILGYDYHDAHEHHENPGAVAYDALEASGWVCHELEITSR